MLAIKNRKLTAQQIDSIFSHRPFACLEWYQHLTTSGDLALTGQDHLLISLLLLERLLDMARFFTLFDDKAGKVIARY